ncbi:MAG: helix-turn-helix domain-containing protein [Clostridiales bacterium]|jgi:carbohydrate diacid regulator|nr:helix-turn-helix domain-containing protein [Clostridiales bacterium]
MLSERILQNALNGLKEITSYDFAAFDARGGSLADTRLGRLPDGRRELFLKISDEEENFECSVGVYFPEEADAADAERALRIACLSVDTLNLACKDRFDRDGFIKKLLLGNLLAAEISERAERFGIKTGAPRVVYVIELGEDKEACAMEVLRGMFPDYSRDFITSVEENRLILIKELSGPKEARGVVKTAEDIAGTLAAEALLSARVAAGEPAGELRDAPRSYGEALTALEAGRIFEPGRSVSSYGNLGIGRLIYHLPLDLCRLFLAEATSGVPINLIDEETLVTVAKFFENNLNVSETSRQLYIHRNTLVYRLDKIFKITGLDLRAFDDAVAFKLAVMVSRFMNYKERE